jgi:hypothetical protein
MNRADEVGTSPAAPVYWIVTPFAARTISGGTVTVNVDDADAARWFAVAAWLTVIVVVPAPTGITCPDEFTVATLVLLLEYDKTPSLTVSIKLKLNKLKEASVVSLFGISAKEITLAMKLSTTLGVDNVSPDGKVPVVYVVTIEGVKVDPTACELNALRISAFVIWILLFPDAESGMTCSYVVEPCVTSSLSSLIGGGCEDIISIYLLDIYFF